MATVKLPLMSMDASDSLGKAITFSKWKGRNYVRKLVKPSNPKSGLQVGMRAGITFYAGTYAALAAATKTNWKNTVKKRSLSGINGYSSSNQKRLRRNLGVLQDPLNAAGAVEAAPTAPAVAVGTRTLTVTWVDSAGANDTCTFVYRSTSTGFTPSISTLVAIIAHGVQKFVDTKVTTGTTYYYVVGGCEKGGTLGTQAAQQSGTPT